MAFVEQYLTQAGSPSHKSHLIIRPFNELIAEYGHAATHMRQPIHLSSSRFTMPSLSMYSAFGIHAATHFGSSHCIHTNCNSYRSNSSRTMDIAPAFGLHSPKCFSEHAIEHCRQPEHFSG